MLSPLVKAYTFKLTDTENKRVEKAFREFSKKWKISESKKKWSTQIIKKDDYDEPMLTLEDVSEIPFIKGIPGVDWYQLRSRTRAGARDYFAATKPELSDYENYNRNILKIGDPVFVYPQVSNKDAYYVCRSLKKDKQTFKYLVDQVKQNKLKILHPYMGAKDVWKLAEALTKAAKKKVRVLSAHPELTRRANGKEDFTELVATLLGEEGVPATYSSCKIGKICKNFRKLSEKYQRVALKMNCYSSAMGNQVFESSYLEKLSDKKLEKLVKDFLVKHEWNEKDPVLAVEWKHDVLQSPSVQTWIPPLGAGLPIIEGVYEQFLKGEQKIFQGSSPSILAPDIQERMARRAFLIAAVFQKMGYVGRCSFDLVLCGKSEESAQDVFVECNGRWGGTSIPMSIMNRIFGDYRKVKYRCMDFSHEKLIGKPFSEVFEIFKEDLYNVETKKGRYIFYNVGCLQQFGKVTAISFGDSREYAFSGILKEMPEKIDRYYSNVLE